MLTGHGSSAGMRTPRSPRRQWCLVPGAATTPQSPPAAGGKKLESSLLRRRLAAGGTGGGLQRSQTQAFGEGESKPDVPRGQGIMPPASQAEKRVAELEEALSAAESKILEMQDRLTLQDALLRATK